MAVVGSQNDAGMLVTCNQQPCQRDVDCIFAGEKCLLLESFGNKKACFKSQAIFRGDKPGDDCVNHPDKVARFLTCGEDQFAACVPKSCTQRSEQPVNPQPLENCR